MPNDATARRLKARNITTVVSVLLPAITGSAVLYSLAFAAQDRFALKIPDGLAFSDFRGYETWQYVAVSQTESSLKVIAANDAMIKAYRDGVPGDGKLFPDGAKIAKIEWSFKKNTASPYFVTVLDMLKTVAFIEKRYQEVPQDARVGLCSVGLRCRNRHVQAFPTFCKRRRMRICVPFKRCGAGLHFHRLSQEVNGESSMRCVR